MDDAAELIDNYEIRETILSSAEGVIYRAVEKSSGSKVLLKEYYPTLNWSENVLNEFFNLLGNLRFIEYEYLLPILDMGKDKDTPYVVFADPSLTLLCHRQPVQASETETLDFLSKLTEVLDFLHKQEIIHGGLNIENVAIDADGYPLVFDFGLGEVFKKLLVDNIEDGFDNLSVANIQCTSPEQIQGRNPTRSSDIYTFGIIGYYYVFGALPFPGQSIPEVAVNHFTRGPIQTIKAVKGISDDALSVIQKCVQVVPEARFESFSQILDSLDWIKSGKRMYLRFDRRFEVEITAGHPPIPRSFLATLVVVLSLFAIAYVYIQRAQAFSPPTQISAPTTIPAATQTETLSVATPTKVVSTATDSLPTPDEIAVDYKLAFEDEVPVPLTEPISIANLADLREISRLGYGKPEEADIAPDNVHVAIATSAGVVIFEGDQFLKWIDPQGWATSVQFSPDGSILAVGLKNGDIQLWNWQRGVISATLTGHTKKINRILFSQNELLLSASDDQHIITWNLNSNQAILDIPAHSKPVNDIAITRDARILVSSSKDRLIRVWDLSSGKKLYELGSNYFTGTIQAIAISSDDAFLAAGGDAGYLYQWNLVTTTLDTVVPQPRADVVPVMERIWSLQYIQDDQQLFVGVDKGKILNYDATRQGFGGLPLRFDIPLPSSKDVDVFGAGFQFDSNIVFREENIVSLNWDGQITFQDAQLVSPMYDVLDRLDFSPDGTILAAGGKRGSTHVWNLTTNQDLYKNLFFLPFGDPIAPDGDSIALIVPKSIRTSAGNEIIDEIYQIKNLSGPQSTRDLLQAVPNAHVGYTSDGSIFIAANLAISKAWEYRNGSETFLYGYTQTGCLITTSPNDIESRLQVNSAAGILPLQDDEHINSLCPKTYQFRGTLSAFSRDLSLLVYMNSNGSLEGYDVLQKSSPWQPYHINNLTEVTALAVSPDGSLIAVGDTAGRLQFINGKSGEWLGKIVGNFGSLHAIKFSDDGTKIATAGQDGVVRVFGVVELK
jgi:WD40 repeat protein/serine/threonine protein kinase